MTLDGLRDRWERMAPRERKLVLLLGVTFIVCIVGWVGVTVSKGLGAIEARNDDARAALEALDGYRARGGGERAKAVEIPAQPVDLSTYLDGIVREVKAQSPAYPSPKVIEHGKFRETSMHVTLKDLSVTQLKDLLEKIESTSRVVVVRELKVKKNFRDREKLDLDMSVSTFHEPSAAPAGGAAPADGAAAAPAAQGGE